MDGKDAIIEKILSDAQLEADEVLRVANDKISERIADANDWSNQYIETQKAAIESERAENLFRRKTVAGLAARKIELKEKQAVLEKTFALALDKLCSLTKKEYLSLVEKNLTLYADQADEVVLSCDKVLSAEDIEKLKITKSKKLTVSKTAGDFKGGIKLIGKVSDKDLTFKSLIETAKADMTVKVAQVLFGE